MAYVLPFTSADFVVQRAGSTTASVVRIRFTHDPKMLDASAVDDALNPVNYSFSGPHAVLPVSVVPVVDDPQAVDVFVNVPLAVGAWTATVNSTVKMEDGTTLAAPFAAAFDVLAVASLEAANGGAKNQSVASIIRRHIPAGMAGEAWDALIDALAAGDQNNWDTAVAAFDQLFTSTASGIYLDRRVNDDGITRPPQIRMPDDLLRQYAIKTRASKLTAQSVLEILEIFYGSDSVRAYAETDVAAPFALEDGQTLRISSDGTEVLEAVFSTADFAQIGVATALEVASAITRQARNAGLGFWAQATAAGKVRIYSVSLGLNSSVTITGGLAQTALQFPTMSETRFAASDEFSVESLGNDTFRYSTSSADGEVLMDVVAGDFVNIASPAFHPDNRGSFAIVAVESTFNGADFDHSFDVTNAAGVAQAGPLTLTDEDHIIFFRPTTNRIYRGTGRTVVAAQTNGTFEVVLPATTQAVGRGEFLAAYPHAQDALVGSAVVTTDGNTQVTTTAPHGLAVGSQVDLSGFSPFLTLPTTVAGVPSTSGNPGTTGAAQTTLWNNIRAPDGLAAFIRPGMALLDSGDILVAGGQNAAAAPVDTATRLRFTGETLLTTGNGKGRSAKTYNWVATSSLPSVLRQHQLVAIDGGALLVGGNDGVASSVVRTYLPDANTWNAVTGSLTARYHHTATRVKDADGLDVVYIVGGLADSANAVPAVQRWTAAGGIAAFASETEGRFTHAAVAVDDNTFLAIGGQKIVGGDYIIRADSYGYNAATSTLLSIGNMATARYHHAAVKLSDGVVMVIGGIGHNLSNQVLGDAATLASAEICDVASGRWRPAGRMKHARYDAAAVLIEGKVYVVGGLNENGNPVFETEIFDPRTGRWSVAPATASVTVGVVTPVAAGDIVVSVGNYDGTTTTAAAGILIPGSNTVGAKVNGTATVTEVLSTVGFIVDAPPGCAVATTGAVTPLAAEAGGIAGPFIWDHDTGLAVTATSGTIQTAIAKGQQYKSLLLDTDEALAFPEDGGWLVLGFGTKHQTAPVRYLGRLSDDELILDFGFRMPFDVPAGASVILLSQKSPLTPVNAATTGSFYLAASSAGRVQAQKAIDAILAEGIEANFTVVYPSDVGLGKAGSPTTGAVLSDKVAIWGGDNLDAELAAARDE